MAISIASHSSSTAVDALTDSPERPGQCGERAIQAQSGSDHWRTIGKSVALDTSSPHRLGSEPEALKVPLRAPAILRFLPCLSAPRLAALDRLPRDRKVHPDGVAGEVAEN